MRLQGGTFSRRRFLTLLGGGALCATLPAAYSQNTAGPSRDNLLRAMQLLSANTVVDFHTHLGLWQTMDLRAEQSPMGILAEDKLSANLREYLDAGCNCVYMDVISDILRTRIGAPGNKDRDFVGDEAWEDYLRQHALMRKLLASMPLHLVRSVDAVKEVEERGELAVIFSSEGAHMLESDPQRLEIMYRHGLRRLQPLHYLSSALGDLQTDPPRFGGLSSVGKELTAIAGELGILLDMAHATQAVVEQTADIVDGPLALSHTMVLYNSAKFGDYRKSRARWVTPEHARIIADTGGVIGTFPIPAPYGVDTAEAFVEAVGVMVDAVGIDHVAWSTDLIDVGRPSFLQDYRDFPRLCAMLLEAGFSDADLLKFVGGNALRVQREASMTMRTAAG